MNYVLDHSLINKHVAFHKVLYAVLNTESDLNIFKV